MSKDGRVYPRESKTQSVMLRNILARSKKGYKMSKYSSIDLT
jgi:hypothetical protein